MYGDGPPLPEGNKNSGLHILMVGANTPGANTTCPFLIAWAFRNGGADKADNLRHSRVIRDMYVGRMAQRYEKAALYCRRRFKFKRVVKLAST
jgi:hypothetical protein